MITTNSHIMDKLPNPKIKQPKGNDTLPSEEQKLEF